MFDNEWTWKCRSCGHKHTQEQWAATATPRYCHACGSGAVTPSNDPKYDWRGALGEPAQTVPYDPDERRAADQGEAMGEAFAAGTLPDEDRRDDEGDVDVPDDIQVDEIGAEVRAGRKPKIKPNRRR